MTAKRRRRGSFDAHVPYDVTRLILERLPAKSLLRLKAVCKRWRSIICDPKFTEVHHRRSHTRMGGNYIASVYLDERKSMNVSFYSHDRRKAPLSYHPNFKTVSDFILDSSYLNGLLCWNCHDYGPGCRALILNITTREVLYLPENSRTGVNYEENKENRYSLGYDPVTEKYKVLKYGSRINILGGLILSEVYTLGTNSNSWRSCANPPNMIMESWGRSTCLNGKIYWLTHPAPGGQSFMISFDVGREVYHIVKCSVPFYNPSNLFMDLEGNLGLVQFCGKSEGNEVWKIEECNSELKVVARRKIARNNCPSKVYFAGISPKGEIVLMDELYEYGKKWRAYYLDLQDSNGALRPRSKWFSPFTLHTKSKYIINVENMLRLRVPSLEES